MVDAHCGWDAAAGVHSAAEIASTKEALNGDGGDFEMKMKLTLLMLLAAASAFCQWPKASELPAQKQLPDPLVMANGKPVTSKNMWMN